MKIFDFALGVDENNLFYAYSPQSRTSNKFTQGDGFIYSNPMPVEEGKVATLMDFEHISLLTKQKYGVGTTITVECDFEKFGAPLLLLTNDLISIDGKQSYDKHVEVVAWEEGINVWDITYAPDKPQKRFISPKKIAFKKFKIADLERIVIKTKILKGGIDIDVNGETLFVEIPDLPETMHVGLTACEGINRFYNLKIEE